MAFHSVYLSYSNYIHNIPTIIAIVLTSERVFPEDGTISAET
jgi:hypothetical protein